MAVLDFPRAAGRAGTNSISRVVIGAAASVVAWNDARRTQKALMQLSAHELDDIGLCRGDVDALSRRR